MGRASAVAAPIPCPMTPRLHPFARLSVAATGLFVVQTVAGIALALIYLVVMIARSPGLPPAQIIAQLTSATEANSLLLTLFVYPIGVLWLGFCRRSFDRRSFISLGLRRSRVGSNLSRGAVTGLLAIAVIWAILWVTGAISVNGFSAAARQPTAVFAVVGWLIAFAAVGFFEEFLFRGYALHNLTNWLGWKWAVLIQAIIFALVHLGNVATAPNEARLAALGAMPSIFLIGIFFALSYRKTGSLWFPIGFHAAWNFALGCLFSLPVSGIKTFQLLDVKANTNSWLSGGSFGAEGSFFLLPVLLALIWLVLQAPDHPQALLDLELTAPPVEAAPTVAQASSDGAEAKEEEPERENRYRTKFGTSEGFDGDMLRELRELQQQRETAEAQAQKERAAQRAIVEVELLKPPTIVAETSADEPETETAATPEPVVAATEAPIVELAQAEAPKIEVPKSEAKPIRIAKEAAVPVKVPVAVAVEEESLEEVEIVAVKEKPAPVPASAPAKKKASPKW